MRVLLTGGGGFVARHVATSLAGMLSDRLDLVVARRSESEAALPQGRGVFLDITDRQAAFDLVDALKPSAIIHLAGISDVSVAERNPDLTWQVNLMGTLHLAHALKASAPEGTFVFAGSSQIYGSKPEEGRPFSERDLLKPMGQYGATKAAADLALGALAAQGLRTIRFRPFNHIGPGQGAGFVVPSFAAQIARIEAGLQPPVIKVGNLDAERDFIDVRDVARAYSLAVTRAETLPAGAMINLASGHPTRIGHLLEGLIALSSVPIAVEVDPERVRPNDIRSLAGNADYARECLGWVPEIPLAETLRDILDEQRRVVREAPRS